MRISSHIYADDNDDDDADHAYTQLHYDVHIYEQMNGYSYIQTNPSRQIVLVRV